MLRGGAIEEVRALLALGLDPALPAMRAHGVPELAAYLRGELALEAADRRIELVTGQYTKRQATWFRHHVLAAPPHAHTIHARICRVREIFGKKLPRNFGNLLKGWVDAPHHPAYRVRPRSSTRSTDNVGRRQPNREQKFSSAP